MAQIMIDTDVLNRCSADLRGGTAEFDGLNGQLQALTGSITATWSGQSSEAFCHMMTAYVAKAQQFRTILERYGEYVDQTRSRFEELDSRSAARIRGLF